MFDAAEEPPPVLSPPSPDPADAAMFIDAGSLELHSLLAGLYTSLFKTYF
jgi:hypothetical protein